MNNFYTVKELADELGISKTYVMKIIRKLNMQSELSKDGNKFVIPKSVVNTIKSVVSADEKENSSQTKIDNSLQTEIEFLKLELANKNEEIKTLHRLLDQQQQLTLKSNNQIEQLTLELKENDVKKLNLWSRLFHKN